MCHLWRLRDGQLSDGCLDIQHRYTICRQAVQYNLSSMITLQAFLFMLQPIATRHATNNQLDLQVGYKSRASNCTCFVVASYALYTVFPVPPNVPTCFDYDNSPMLL